MDKFEVNKLTKWTNFELVCLEVGGPYESVTHLLSKPVWAMNG